MSAGFVNLDRQTPLFPPCDLREWLPAGHLVHFILEAVEQKNDGPPSGLTVYAAVGKPGRHKTVADLLPRSEPAPLAANASPEETTARRLQTSVGKQLYKPRKQTVEPALGIIKSVRGFRRFLLRGREKVSLEWLLVCVSYHFKRLCMLKNAAPAGEKRRRGFAAGQNTKTPPPQAPHRAPQPSTKRFFRQPPWCTPVDLAKIFFLSSTDC